MQSLILDSRAAGTTRMYVASIRRWNEFAATNDMVQSPPADQDLAMYITKLDEAQAPLSTFNLLSLALTWYHAVRNRQGLPAISKPFIRPVGAYYSWGYGERDKEIKR